MQEIRKAVNLSGRARLARNNVGKAVPITQIHLRPPPVVAFGLGLGSADLVGVLVGSGRAFCLEVKSRTGTIKRAQKIWAAAARRIGVFVGVARSVEEAMACVGRAEAGATQ